MAYKKHVRKGGGDFPHLLTAKEFAAHIRKSYRWVREACEDGRILACAIVGGDWIIAADTLIRPRHMEGFPSILLDTDLPEEMILGEYRVDSTAPVYAERKGNPHPIQQRLMSVPGLQRIGNERGYSRAFVSALTGVHKNTVGAAWKGGKVTPQTVLKLAQGLEVDPMELIRRG